MEKLFADPSVQIKLPGQILVPLWSHFSQNFTEPGAPPAAQSALAAVNRWLLSGSKRSMMARRRNTTA